MRNSSKVTLTQALGRGVAVGRGAGVTRFATAVPPGCGDGSRPGVAVGGRGVCAAVGDPSAGDVGWSVGWIAGRGVDAGGATAVAATTTGIAAAGVLVGGTMMRTGVGGAAPPHPASAPAAINPAAEWRALRMM